MSFAVDDYVRVTKPSQFWLGARGRIVAIRGSGYANKDSYTIERPGGSRGGPFYAWELELESIVDSLGRLADEN